MKDREIMCRWAAEAYKKAAKNGFRRMIDVKLLIDNCMGLCVTTNPEDEKNVMNAVYDKLMTWEKLCQLIAENNLSVTYIKEGMEVIQW